MTVVIVDLSYVETFNDVHMPKDLNAWLALTVVGTIIATLGSLLGIVIKDLWLARSLEHWKAKISAKQAHRALAKPLHESAKQLIFRFVEVYDHYPPNYLESELLRDVESSFQVNDISDPHFRRYKLLSTAHRMCAFFGWLELYQRQVLALEERRTVGADKINAAISNIRRAFADGQINTYSDWEDWKDRLIFRDEQRAIGEAMIVNSIPPHAVAGYGGFIENIRLGKQREWLLIAFNFLVDHELKDFRKERIRRAIGHLFELMLAIDSKLPSELAEAHATHV